MLDAVTGFPVDPGPATAQLTFSRALDLGGRPVVIDEVEADAEGRFSLQGESRGQGSYALRVSSAGEVDYPAAAAYDAQFEPYGIRNPWRRAYFTYDGARIETVALTPTAFLVVRVQLDRELATGERLAVTVEEGVGEDARPYGSATFHPGGAPLRSDMLVPGGRELVARWELVRGDAVVTSGAEPVTTVRHEQGELLIDVSGG